jgi:hypothetical protein
MRRNRRAQLASSGWLRPEQPGGCLEYYQRRPALEVQHTAQMKDAYLLLPVIPAA